MIAESQFPADFINRMHSLLGNEAIELIRALQQPSCTSVRLNPFKPTEKFSQCENVPWCHYGKYLEKRPSFTFDPLFHSGTYYVQEASSMFLSEILKQTLDITRSLKVLDLCASPGGKSTLLLSEISADSLLVCNEAIRHRIPALIENMVKWGRPNYIVTNNDADDFIPLKNYFDVIIVDAPCSGEGLFRKDKEAINEWSTDNITMCAARQKRILRSVIQSLKEGGILIYSTCTFSPEENEDNMKFLADRGNFDPVRIELDLKWNIVERIIPSAGKDFFSYHFFPHRVKSEGFFIYALQKKSNCALDEYEPDAKRKNYRDNDKMLSTPVSLIPYLKSWLRNPAAFQFFSWNGYEYAMPEISINDLKLINSHLNIRNFGIRLGKLIKQELIPAHDLAMATELSDKIPSNELEYDDAIKYLRKEEIGFDGAQPGWLLMRYNNKNLGWVKQLSNRINNYYPKDWRILRSPSRH